MTDNAQLYAGELANASDAMRTLNVSVTIAGKAIGALVAFYQVIHQVDLLANPRRHGHCPTCHPEQDRRPLAVNGREYHRRQRARQRRRRHGH